MRAGKRFIAANCLLAITLSVLTPAQAQLPATRGLETSGLDQFVQALQSKDSTKVAAWFEGQAARFKDATSPLEQQFHRSMENLAAVGNSTKLAPSIFQEQMKLRRYITLSKTSDLAKERILFVTMQSLLEEAVMFANQETQQNQFTFRAASITQSEKLNAGLIRGIEVLPGDVLVQIGANYLSSHFIAHSQSNPGLASHGYLVSETGGSPEILESLIEDGVNRREPTKSALARMWVLSLVNPSDREQVGDAAQKFIHEYKIPFVQDEKFGQDSPLLYDSTMNPDRKKDGYYFCTALVQEIYQRAGVAANQVPYLQDQTNWNSLTGTEKLIYEQLDIKRDRIPAPSDALMQPNLQIRGLTLDAEGLRSSRRLRAVVDAFYDLMNFKPEIRAELFKSFALIPAKEIRKKEILEALAKIPTGKFPKLDKYRGELEQSLPQTANLRQIAFFMLLNNVIQDKALANLKAYEVNELKRHALPAELRARAAQLLQKELQFLNDSLKTIGTAYLQN